MPERNFHGHGQTTSSERGQESQSGRLGEVRSSIEKLTEEGKEVASRVVSELPANLEGALEWVRGCMSRNPGSVLLTGIGLGFFLGWMMSPNRLR
jgi:hypothetical protein